MTLLVFSRIFDTFNQEVIDATQCFVMPAIRFLPNVDKVLEALVLIGSERPGIDVFHVCKVLFFADKAHLNRYGRPISGDTYWALDQGPVPSLAYDMIERDEFHLYGLLLEKLSAALAYEKSRTDDYLRISAKRAPDLDMFSGSDLECLREAITLYADMDSEKLGVIAHAQPAYKAVYKKGQKPSQISYELIVDKDNPMRDEIIADLKENSGLLVL